MSINSCGNNSAIKEARTNKDFNCLAERQCKCIRDTTALFIAASKYRNISHLLGVYVPITSIMSASRHWYETFQPVMDVQAQKTVEAALEMMPQFNSVLTESDKKKSPMGQLGKLVLHAKKQMSADQYQAIREKYPNPVCMAFFVELKDQIQENKLKALQELDLSDNQLESIDVSYLAELCKVNSGFASPKTT